MRALFKDDDTQRLLSDKGYVQLPLLSAEDIQNLLSVFSRYTSQYSTPFHTSHFSVDKGYKNSVNDAITGVVFKKAARLLNNCRPIFGNFMVKNARSDYFMPLHADWTYVDETRFRSIAIWVPLMDVNENNGCLGVIEGSHKVLNGIRGPRIQQSSYRNDERWVKQLGKLLPMTAGSAIIYDHALMHYSPPNKTPAVRPAVNLSVVPAEADVVHYCIPEGISEIEVYKVHSNSFFINYDNYQRPETNSLFETLPVNSVKWIDERMEKFVASRLKKSVIRRVTDFLTRTSFS